MSTSSRSRSSAWLLAVAVAGCTAAFGLDRTARDTDGDGIDNTVDNCPTVANPLQEDLNHDSVGDACGICPVPTAIDIDQDGIDDGCDPCIGSELGRDDNANLIDDGCEPCLDGHSSVEFDSDSDGILDGCDDCIGQLFLDTDHDGVDDFCDVCPNGPPGDQDGDGLQDWCDNCPVVANPGQEIDAGDIDNVGAVCDPHPMGNDARKLLDGFVGFSPDRWQELPNPSWTFDLTPPKNVVRVEALSSAQLGGNLDVWPSRVLMSSDFVVALGALIEKTSAITVAVVITNPKAPVEQLRCELATFGTGTVTLVATYQAPDGSLPIQELAAPVAAENSNFEIRLKVGTNAATCELGTAKEAIATTSKISVMATIWEVGLGVRGGGFGPVSATSVAELDWIEALELVPTP